MVLALALICSVPVLIIIMVFFAIGAAGAKTYRAGKRTYVELKPYIDNMNASAVRAQQRGTEFARRGDQIGKNIEEISGRIAFITEAVKEGKNSPVIKAMDIAGRFIK